MNKERGLVDIITIAQKVTPEGKLKNPTWHRGIIHPRTRYEVMHCPPGVSQEIPMQLEGIGEGEQFAVIDIFEELTPEHWDIWRSDS